VIAMMQSDVSSASESYEGIDIHYNPYVPKYKREQVIFPRSKRKRILKKFENNPANYKDVPHMYFMGGGIVCHPEIYAQVKEFLSWSSA
jgi:hypothetical protein